MAILAPANMYVKNKSNLERTYFAVKRSLKPE